MIAVIGLGFVGLTTALGLAHKCEADVYGYDVDKDKMAILKSGKIPFYEPQLKEMLSKYKNKSFHLCDSMNDVVENAEVIFFCVGTPALRTRASDLSILKNAVLEVLKHISKGKKTTLVIKSTVPPTTTHDVILPLIKEKGFEIGVDVNLANNPEFLREGFAFEDFINPDRIIIGSDCKITSKILRNTYRHFKVPIYEVSLNTAEFIKYLSNTLLATLISFSNEMSIVAEHMGDIDIPKAFKILHEDKRMYGKPAPVASYIYPGCGFGGYCLPKDTQAICAASQSKGYTAEILENVTKVNNKIKKHMARKIMDISKKEDCIGILGLSFKPQSDDVRNASSKDIIKKLLNNGYKNIIAYDPMAVEPFKTYKFNIKYAKNMEELVKKSDTIVLLTAWEEFLAKKEMLKDKKVIDARYCLGDLNA